MGKLGKGRGGIAPEEQTNVGFKTERGKVHTGKGAVIGQFYFEGEQVKGEVNKNIAEVVSAAEREASDRMSRDRVPRQYQKSVKEYFSTVQRSIEKAERDKDTDGKDDKDNAGESDKPASDEKKD